jgi:hypothetical protein
MHDQAGVRGIERIDDLPGQRQGLVIGDRSASVSPGTSSRTRKVASAARANPWMAAMLGWFSEARTRASRSKRTVRSGSAANMSGRTLSATSRPSDTSRARYTSPIPPAPSSEKTS